MGREYTSAKAETIRATFTTQRVDAITDGGARYFANVQGRPVGWLKDNVHGVPRDQKAFTNLILDKLGFQMSWSSDHNAYVVHDKGAVK